MKTKTNPLDTIPRLLDICYRHCIVTRSKQWSRHQQMTIIGEPLGKLKIGANQAGASSSGQ